jgi:hypothetical protein
VGASYVRLVTDAGGKPRFYQEEFGPGVMLACGRGYQNPDVSALPSLQAFLAVTQDRFSCDELPSRIAVLPLRPMQRAFRYQIATVGAAWRVSGLAWSRLSPLYGLFYGATVVAAYALFRIATGPVLAAGLSLALTVSTIHLIYLPHLRDYSKAPFIIALLVALGWLAQGPTRTRRVLAIAAAYGAVLGIGMGFRNDLLIAWPPFMVVVIGFLPGRLRDRLRLTAAAIGVAAATFAVAMLPMWAIYAPGGGNSMQHVMLLGLVTPFNDALGVANGRLYDWGYDFKDEYAHALVSAQATRVHGATAQLELYGPDYDRTAGEYIKAVAANYPADIVVRVFASIVRVLELPYSRTSLEPPTWLANARLVRAYHARERVLRGLGSVWPLIIVAALAGVTLADPRLMVLLAGVVVYFAAYPVLQFNERHYFHLEFIAWWALGLLLQAAVTAIRGARHAAGRNALLERLRAHPWKRRLALAAVLWIAMGAATGGALAASRRYQQEHVRAMITGYMAAPLEPLDLRAAPAVDGAIRFDSPSRTATVVAAAAGDAVHSEYYVADFSGACSAFKFDVTFRYQFTEPVYDFSRTMQIRPPIDPGAAQRVFFPAYFHRARTADAVQGGYGLAGIELPASAQPCLSGLYRVRDPRGLPALWGFNLPPKWESATLYYTLAGWEPRSNGEEQPDIYTFPAGLAVSRTTLAAPLSPLTEADIDQRAPNLSVQGGEWVVDGAGGVGGRGPFLYLAQMKGARIAQGTMLIARGRLDDGGISVGLVRDGAWVAQVPVTSAGEFLVVVRTPADGTYSAVLANNLVGRSFDNHVRLRQFGWVAP